MPLVVQKYGGSSLASPKHIQRAATRIKSLKATGTDVVVVASAMGHMTDHLLKLARKTVKYPPGRELDMLLTVGERISMSLLAMKLQEEGVPAISFTGSQSGIITTNDHTEATILEIRPSRIEEELKKGKVVIIAGFQGVSVEKEITTLGRGGSDTTAVALSAVLKANECQILTDVDGLFSADPRLVPTAKLLDLCTYDEALELSRLGAKMHPRSIEVAKRFQVKLSISSSRTDSRGTQLFQGPEKEESMTNPIEKTTVKGITTKDGFHYFQVEANSASLLPLLNELRSPIRFFSATSTAFTFLIEKELAPSVSNILDGSGIRYLETPKICLISAVGEGITTSRALLPRFLSTIKENKTEALLLTSNSLSLSAAVPSEKKEAIARALHAELVEKEN
jgi:aspartate kinase